MINAAGGRTMSDRMGRVLWLEQCRAWRRDADSVRPDEPSDGGDAVWEVRGTDASVEVAEHVDIDVLAILERLMPVDATGDNETGDTHGSRSFILWADTRRHEVFARVVTESIYSRRMARYTVNGSQGESLASITCRRAAWLSPRRTRWIVEQAGQPAAVGYQGRALSRPARCVTAPPAGRLLYPLPPHAGSRRPDTSSARNQLARER
ncbi:hypothetical protein [Phytoactinopolyspora mesophila]|uniref:Uncharacterized protein n=1 Tax=Phytoactinopolyspora mesophila TaxID=2650750 RepID=A0A7K3M1L3_9ACTN|nr:hypothetical protein [Phytoactinopolyspora mesophila]NDL57186.1 hypothetical protein [Phytoactinopolyspora mesophila]